MSVRPETPHEDGASGSATVATGPAKVARTISWRKKAAFAAIVCLLFFGLLEGLLAFCGVRPLYLTRDPYLGFQPGMPLFVRDGDTWRTNSSRLTFFNDQRFPAAKPANAYRIFCLGGSTTFGHPYHDQTSYCGWLREFLRETAPERDWEVVNCGGVSYASYRECLLMQELIAYEPDLFVVFSGHNEFLEDRSYAAMREKTWLHKLLDTVVLNTRLGSIADRLVHRPADNASRHQRLPAEVDTILEHSIGPSSYRRNSEHHRAVVSHFEESLLRMCDVAQSAGAEIVFISPASNVKDFSPFKSEHGILGRQERRSWEKTTDSARAALRRGEDREAARQFRTAAGIDTEYAQGLWDAGNAFFVVKEFDDAREFYWRAVDEDICPLRAGRPLLHAVNRVAALRHKPVIDFPTMLEEDLERTEGHRIPGDESFLDHVHPTIEVHRKLAWKIYDQIAQWGVVAAPLEPGLVDRDVAARVMATIDSRAHAFALVQVIQVLSWAGKNEEALRLADRAEELHPGLSEVVSYRGRLLEKLNREEEAFGCFQEAVRRNPDDSVARFRLAFALARREQYSEAAENFEASVRLTPESAPASFRSSLRMGLGQCYLKLERWADAASQLDEVLRITPRDDRAVQLRAIAALNARSARR